MCVQLSKQLWLAGPGKERKGRWGEREKVREAVAPVKLRGAQAERERERDICTSQWNL